MDIKLVGHVALSDIVVVFKENYLTLPRRKSIVSHLVFIAQSRTQYRAASYQITHISTCEPVEIADECMCHSAYRIHARHAESVTIEGNYYNHDVCTSELRD